jgi:hypothetical protein
MSCAKINDMQSNETQVLPVVLRMNVALNIDGRPINIQAQVEGEGESAQRAAETLSNAIASIVSQAGASTRIASPQNLAALAPQRSDAPKQLWTSPLQRWVQHNRTRINVISGGALLALALVVPLIVPIAQRRDVLIMTILFGLTGALLLLTAYLPGRASIGKVQQETPQFRNSSSAMQIDAATLSARRAALLKPEGSSSRVMKAGWGLALGAVFVVAGLAAPFALGATSADERFVIMLGFAPIIVVGFFMLAIFGRPYWLRLVPLGPRNTQPNQVSNVTTTPSAKRAPVSRVPQTVEYRAIVPIAIVTMLILMAAILALVIYATVLSAAR